MPAKNKKHILEARNYSLPADFPVLLLTGEKWKISDIPAESLHFHNCQEIGLCHAGNGILQFQNGQTVSFTAGDMTCIPQNVPHSTCSTFSTSSKWSYLFFEPKRLFWNITHSDHSLFLAHNNVSDCLIPAGASPRLSFLMQTIIEELSRETVNRSLARSYLFALSIELSRLDGLSSAADISADDNTETEITPPRTILTDHSMLSIIPALDYIDSSYMNKFPIEYLAELCHLSPTHFRRVFQAIMHTSPLNYLNSVRITRSCSLLLNTNYTILSIAGMSGFSTLSNFNRHFSRMMKTSPSNYRKQMLLGKNTGKKPSIIEQPGWMEP